MKIVFELHRHALYFLIQPKKQPVQQVSRRRPGRIEHPIVHIQHAQPGDQLDDFDQRAEYGAGQYGLPRPGFLSPRRLYHGKQVPHRHHQQQVDRNGLQTLGIVQTDGGKISANERPQPALHGKRLSGAAHEFQAVGICLRHAAGEKGGVDEKKQIGCASCEEQFAVMDAFLHSFENRKRRGRRRQHDGRAQYAAVGE